MMRKGIPWRIVAEEVNGRWQWRLQVGEKTYEKPFRTWFAAEMERKRELERQRQTALLSGPQKMPLLGYSACQ